MKKILSIIILIVGLVFVALALDWGRKEVQAPVIDTNSTTTSVVDSGLPIRVDNIKDGQEVSNPFVIKGYARGYWFFEASFPIELVDINGNILTTAIAQAEGEWMTTDFVPFSATLSYVKPTSTKQALIVLSKDNPSGDPDKDQSIFIPVVLK